jgi:hypothetical protein
MDQGKSHDQGQIQWMEENKLHLFLADLQMICVI